MLDSRLLAFAPVHLVKIWTASDWKSPSAYVNFMSLRDSSSSNGSVKCSLGVSKWLFRVGQSINGRSKFIENSPQL